MAYSTNKSTAIHANGHTIGYCVRAVDMNESCIGLQWRHNWLFLPGHTMSSWKIEVINWILSMKMSRVSKALIKRCGVFTVSAFVPAHGITWRITKS